MNVEPAPATGQATSMHKPLRACLDSFVGCRQEDTGQELGERMAKRVVPQDRKTTSGSSPTPNISGLALTCGCYEDMRLRNAPEMIPDGPPRLSTPVAASE